MLAHCWTAFAPGLDSLELMVAVDLPTWTTRTLLYANFFSARCSAYPLPSRPLILHRRTSVQVYAERLKRLLTDVEKQLG